MENVENVDNRDDKENIKLEPLPKDGERMLKELSEGNMVVARSNNDFVYMVAYDDHFHWFSHSPGAPGGGQKQVPIDEQHTAIIRKMGEMADAVFLVEFDKGMNLYGVMYTAEEGILSMFPGESWDFEGMVDFGLPEQ